MEVICVPVSFSDCFACETITEHKQHEEPLPIADVQPDKHIGSGTNEAASTSNMCVRTPCCQLSQADDHCVGNNSYVVHTLE